MSDQTVVAIADLVARTQALNLTLNDIARDAGVHPATAYRAGQRGDCRLKTAARLTAALIARERALLAHLDKLHRPRGDPRQLDLVDAIARERQ